MTTLYAEVHNKILALLKASPGVPLAWDGNTGEVLSLVDDEPVAGKVLEIGPSESSYGEAQNKREGSKRDRVSWQWGARVAFSSPVDTDAIETDLSQSNTFEKSDDIEGFIVELESMIVSEPPRQDGEGGTVLDLTFNVRTTRI